MIVISGLPRSGNHVIRAMVLRCIRMKRRDPNWQGEKCTVWHGAESAPVFEPNRTRFVIPVRDPHYRMLSMRATTLPPGRWPEDACRKGVFNAIVALGAPVKLLSYEAFVANPDGVGQDLIAWLGYAWMPFPPEVKEHDPLNGAIFDGNAKYQCLTPAIDVCGTRTGRMSAANPNLANGPSRRASETPTGALIGSPPFAVQLQPPPSST